MAYILGLVVVGLFFTSLYYFKEITKRQKVVVTAIFLAVTFGAIAYNMHSSSQQQQILDVVTAYKQHKEVYCNEVVVSDTNWSLSVGTYTFIGKKDTPNYAQMISVSKCTKVNIK